MGKVWGGVLTGKGFHAAPPRLDGKGRPGALSVKEAEHLAAGVLPARLLVVDSFVILFFDCGAVVG